MAPSVLYVFQRPMSLEAHSFISPPVRFFRHLARTQPEAMPTTVPHPAFLPLAHPYRPRERFATARTSLKQGPYIAPRISQRGLNRSNHWEGGLVNDPSPTSLTLGFISLEFIPHRPAPRIVHAHPPTKRLWSKRINDSEDRARPSHPEHERGINARPHALRHKKFAQLRKYVPSRLTFIVNSQR